MLQLEELKSAVKIEDQAAIHRALSERKHTSPQTSIGQTTKGATKVMKAAGNAAPKASDLTSADLQALVGKRGMAWDPAYEGRAMAYWASDERVDAHGDIMRQNWVFDEFEGNSPMPFNHGWDGLAIGRIVDWKVLDRQEKGYDGDALWLLGLFATAEQNGFADSVFRLVKGGIFPAGSVGVWPEFLIRVEDAKERAKLGMPEWGFILDRPHLLEFSPTLLGANHGALAIYSQAKSRGLLKAEDFVVIREAHRQQLVRGSGDAQAWREIEDGMRSIQRLLFSGSRFERHEALDEPLVPKDGEESLRGRVAADADSIEDRLDQITRMLNDGLPSVMAAIEDIRETVEGLKERPSQGAKHEAEGDAAVMSATLDHAELLLSKLGSVNT